MADTAHDGLYGPGEVAKRVGYSLSGLRRLERLGILPSPVRLGNGRRIYREGDLQEVEERIRQRRADLASAKAAA